MSDHCPECGRVFGDGGEGDPTDILFMTLEEVRLLALKWQRSSVASERMMGADLMQVLGTWRRG
jgi:hypothetical protein